MRGETITTVNTPILKDILLLPYYYEHVLISAVGVFFGNVTQLQRLMIHSLRIHFTTTSPLPASGKPVEK